MKKIIILISALFMFAGNVYAEDRSRVYVSGKMGANFLNDRDIVADGERATFDFKTGFTGSVALGIEKKSTRFELEYGYRKSNFDSARDNPIFETLPDATQSSTGGVRTHSFLVNGYYDFLKPNIISPYVGVGIGFAWQTEDGTLTIEDDALVNGKTESSTNKTRLELGSQILAGVNLEMTKNLNLDLGYRFFMTSREVRDHNIEAGIRVSF